jgi:hypothetical protein
VRIQRFESPDQSTVHQRQADHVRLNHKCGALDIGCIENPAFCEILLRRDVDGAGVLHGGQS